MKNYEEMYEYLKERNATHLLKFYDELSAEEQTNLLEQIETIDFDLMKSLYDNRDVIPDSENKIEPIGFTKFDDISEEDKKRCYQKQKDGSVPTCRRSRLKTWSQRS